MAKKKAADVAPVKEVQPRGCMDRMKRAALVLMAVAGGIVALVSMSPSNQAAVAATKTARAEAVVVAQDVAATETPIPITAVSEVASDEFAIGETYYAATTTDIRTCAETACAVLGELVMGDGVYVISALNGEPVDTGNQIWYRVTFGAGNGYVYSGPIQRIPVATAVVGGGIVTNTPVVAAATASPTVTVTTAPAATMTNTPVLTEESALQQLPGVSFIGRIERQGSNYFAIVKTFPKFNKQSFAELIYIQALKVNPRIDKFAVKIDDDSSDPLWWIFADGVWTGSVDAPLWADFGSFGSTEVVASAALPATVTTAPVATSGVMVTITSPTTYYALTGGANVRSCTRADTSCGVLTKLAANMPIVSDGRVNGDAVNAGNAVWYRVAYQGQVGYVYSGVMGTQPVVVAPVNPIAPVQGSSSSNNNSSPSQGRPVSGAAPQCSTFDWSVCSNYQTPRNCDAAVAMGIPARDTACCFPARDGDKDGEACYGT